MPVRAGSPPLAAAKACHAWLTQTITPSRSSSATSTPTSGSACTRPAGEAPGGEAPGGRLRRLPLVLLAFTTVSLALAALAALAALSVGDRTARADSTDG